MVKPILEKMDVEILEGTKVDVKARVVTVTGKRGTLTRDFKHLNIEIKKGKNKKGKDAIVVEKWFGAKKELAAVRSVCSHINNMMVGVTHGYEYKMKLVYAHFPINVNCEKIGNSKVKNLIEIRNYLGQKVTFKVPMQEGCEVDRTKEKDEIVITGNSIEGVGTSVSQIQQMCQVKHKDIRKYLDGVYCTTKKVIGQ
ncbi:large subunit ribosomal protein L9e, cytoplasmic [Guillardia theta CCMP2712]|uniref:Large subunit ribosomal protein L9e, cytoplasmic n=2 Tax=Guillardia theta TaxID=55529 RepID=L1JLH5_GUITC|nr:large subunit ribosomal protein L9e, cytoplasmic [Guillardia theta CCMP2712]EKX49014.1 large subunit ribosomal protein L9e, cytoplasmic [Guillardia theta CCMP2712]|eukprot:XP_005835994.1 large subunit ribosomal protein L9e, cytoplasmic [Guillardia theta CCMP2712]